MVDVTFGDVVRAIVTADRRLYPDDAPLLRGSLVEALRRRGIYPGKVTSLTDEALAWPRPAVPLTLTATPGLDEERIDLSAVILSATQDLDLTGRAGDLISDPDDQDQVAGLPSMKATAPALIRWARANAEPLGLDPDTPVELHGVHVAYRQAADRQPPAGADPPVRPAPPRPRGRPPARAAPGGAARRHVRDRRRGRDRRVPGPQAAPRSRPPDGGSDAGRRFSDEGQRRLEAIRGWLGRLDDGDALNAWTLQPASKRLTFANLHAGRTGRRGDG